MQERYEGKQASHSDAGSKMLSQLLGAVAVFVLSDLVTTPLPWLRLDALTVMDLRSLSSSIADGRVIQLNIVWAFPTFTLIATQEVKWAWKIAATMFPISLAWAAGDASLAAYIQAALL